MKRRLAWLLPALLGVALGGLAARRHAPQSLPSVAADPSVVVRIGSRLLSSGGLEPGAVGAPGPRGNEAPARARQTLSRIPPDLRPARLLLDLEPRLEAGVAPIDGVEYHRGSGSLLVGSANDVPAELWLHEAAHVRMAGARPKGAVARRLIGAIEEGFADYFAAVVAEQPRLGVPPRQRDLRAAPRIGASEWASLAFDGFDQHRMGWALAARLYELDPAGGSLLRDAVACLDGDSELRVAGDTPAAAIAALLGACPEQGRPRLARVLSDWLPRELQISEIPT